MHKANFLKFLGILLLLISSSFASFIYGDIYSSNLDKINKTLIRVEGRFSYQFVSEKSNYSIFLPDGAFNISASYLDANGKLLLYSKEEFRAGDKDQKIDLVLKPVREFDLGLIGFSIIAVVGITVLLFWLNSRNKKEKEQIHDHEGKQPSGSDVPPKLNLPIELDQDAKSVLSILESLENRTTQSELKDKTNFSDAKLSLILSELEQLGKIKKFKRGRGNIIRKL